MNSVPVKIKRMLLDGEKVYNPPPEVQVWTDWVETEPWDSMEELLSTLQIDRLRRTRALSPEKVARIRELRGQVSTRQISMEVGCSQSTVRKYLSE